MATPLRVLILEDREADAELMAYELRQAGFDPVWERVDTEADYLAKLDPAIDVILADYTLPQFLAPKALQLLQERGLDIPFIVVTGSVGEEVAVECIKQGAADYLVKWRLARLGAAMVRTLEERRLRTERKGAEERLRLQGTALHAAANAIIITDREGQITWANPAFTQLTGYTLEEVLGKNPRFLKSGRQDPSFYRTLWETILVGRVWRGEIVNRRRDGSLYVEEQTITPVRDEQGAITHFVSIRQDITERKLGEEALADRTRQLEAIRAVTQEITRELDLTTLLRLINRRATELVGATTGTVYLWDESAQVLVPEAWHGPGDWRGDIRLRLGEGVAGTVAEQRVGLIVNDYRASPYALPVFLAHTRATAILGEPLLYRGRLLGAITVDNEGSGAPFTQRDRECLALFAAQAAIAIENAQLYEAIRQHAAKLEARVEERTRELADASRHKSEFLANMSHELRTSLNSVLVFAQILQDETTAVLSSRQARFLTNIYNSGQHLLQLINDILDLSKVEAGKFVLRPEPLPLEESLDDILVIARGLANKKGQTVQTEIEAELPSLYADPVRFKQILFNLLSNAVKFTPEGGMITVRAYQQAAGSRQQAAGSHVPSASTCSLPTANCQMPALVIEVADTGIGIKAEDLPRLFQEFVQLESSTNTSHEGTGLGLALTKRLVELHGGRIWATSEGEGRGSTFTVLLPFAGPAA